MSLAGHCYESLADIEPQPVGEQDAYALLGGDALLLRYSGQVP